MRKKSTSLIIRFTYEHLQNEVHVEFHAVVNVLFVRFNPETLGIGQLYPAYKSLFDPAESIDFNGNTGPFIQYTHARIKSVLRKAAAQGLEAGIRNVALSEREVELVKRMANFPVTVREAGEAHSPALIANYIYELAKEFNQYYHEAPILREPDESTRAQRLLVLQQVANIIKTGMGILGIDVPERM